ncbi:MAG: DUF1700 domain-containing protein [Oscillospiraceae bacterium]
MNRRDFFTGLIGELRNLESSELQDVLQYYNEYFDEAGVENEEAVIAELGSIKDIAIGIRANSATRYLETGKSSTKKSLNAVWISIGAIFAAPIALPLAIAFGILAIALVITFAALLFTFFAVAFSFALSGVLLTFASFILIPASPSSFLLAFGAGLILAGLSILVFIPTLMITRSSFKGIAIFINRKILRRNHNNG